jgi:hypothetical protein
MSIFMLVENEDTLNVDGTSMSVPLERIKGKTLNLFAA